MSDEHEQPFFAEDGEAQQAFNQKAIDSFKHPIDLIEPMDVKDTAYKEAARRFMYVMNYVLSSAIEAENPRNQLWAISFALGAGVCNGKSMDAVGHTLGIGRAALSKSAKAFSESLNLPPSNYMKSKAASIKYRESRVKSINNANNNSKNLLA